MKSFVLLIPINAKAQQNMDYTIPIEKIQETPTYMELARKKDKIPMSFLERREIRKLITYGLNVFKNKGEIPGDVTGYNRKVVLDLIEMERQNKKP